LDASLLPRSTGIGTGGDFSASAVIGAEGAVIVAAAAGLSGVLGAASRLTTSGSASMAMG
jgi:hypothetical protein